MVDMQGRLMGKRFHARHFVDSAWEETHCCNYLLATDLEMARPTVMPRPRGKAAMATTCCAPTGHAAVGPWLEGTALVLCDVLDHHGHAPVPIRRARS